MAYLDKGIGEAYVSPQIEAALGFSQDEWLEDPVRWYDQIYPDDKQRWSAEAAEMFLSGKPLKSAYRVLARDGRVLWFHCEAEMIRREDGRPWFIHGVGVDITELKQAEEALQEERNVLSAILDIVGALIVVLDPQGRIVRFNRACEQTTGYSFAEVQGKYVWDLFLMPEEVDNFKAIFEQPNSAHLPGDYETYWLTRDGSPRLITWSSTILAGKNGRDFACDRHRNRYHRTQAARKSDSGSQRTRATPNWRRFARWPRPASDRHRFHEQSPGKQACAKKRCRNPAKPQRS